MNRTKNLLVYVLIAVLLTSTGLWVHRPGSAQANEPGLFRLAPLNPAFLEYLKTSGERDSQPLTTAEGNLFGYIPPPVDLSHLRESAADQITPMGFPSSFDLRATGRLTPVKNQVISGPCWAFAAYASLESYLLPGESLNFSENHLKNRHGFNWAHNDGGNAVMAAAYLARWDGHGDE
jgi:C1A family cysteine protease